MSALFQRLQSLLMLPEALSESGSVESLFVTVPANDRVGPRPNLPWEFREKLARLGARTDRSKQNFFESLVRLHPLLELEYSVHCTHLAHNLARAGQILSEEEKRELTNQLLAALAMAELLEYIYYHYLDVQSEVLRLQNEQELYRSLLSSQYEFSRLPKYEVDPAFSDSFSQDVRWVTAWFNFPRLFAVRIRRVLIMLLPILQNFVVYGRLFDFADQFVASVLNRVAWLFFAPRLAVNLFLLLQHVINPLMAEKEAELSWVVRLQAQLQRRWFLLANDSVWFTFGLLNCYVFTGALTPVSVYVMTSLFFYDVIVASIRAFIELRRINEIREKYNNIRGATNEECAEIINYRKHLDQRLSCEWERIRLGVFSMVGLFLGMFWTMPLFASNPIIPLIGAIIVLVVTIATCLENNRIENRLNELDQRGSLLANSRYRMFQPARPTSSNEVNPLLEYSVDCPNILT